LTMTAHSSGSRVGEMGYATSAAPSPYACPLATNSAEIMLADAGRTCSNVLMQQDSEAASGACCKTKPRKYGTNFILRNDVLVADTAWRERQRAWALLCDRLGARN